MWNTIVIYFNYNPSYNRNLLKAVMYEATRKENEKVAGLDQQMIQVDEDFETMMRIRNEEKRKLELKFKDVYQ
jgi:hypothetical protein